MPISISTSRHTWEVNGAIVVCVDLVDHILQLRLRGILTQRSHDCAQLLRSDLSYVAQGQIDVWNIGSYQMWQARRIVIALDSPSPSLS